MTGSATKQSGLPPRRKSGLLRIARTDGRECGWHLQGSAYGEINMARSWRSPTSP